TFDPTSEKLICVPITETSFDYFMRAVTDAASVADAVELRVDYLTHDDAQRAIKFLSDPKNKIQKPLILTCRPREQGGQRDLPFIDRRDFWRGNSGWETIAYADLEFDLVEDLANVSAPIPWEKVICSWHDFAETPHDLIARYDLMASTPAAVVKIAARANR